MFRRSICRFQSSLRNGPDLQHFLKTDSIMNPTASQNIFHDEIAPYLSKSLENRNVYIETYGCQMNVNDTEIVLGILKKHGGFSRVESIEQADIALLMTCAIRENAESKIWNRLDALRAFERGSKKKLTVGVLGCMAERLKDTLIERKNNVDLVCGPDAYRSLPGLLKNAESGQTGVNVVLSFDETYADISPVRINDSKKSAFISVMRGCDNMCAFCIVPFTRGRERSRPIDSIVGEAQRLRDDGVKEITLLGQNVNSYRDESSVTSFGHSEPPGTMSAGFKTVYKPKNGGLRFSTLLEQVSSAVPEVRIRFTSPHPKDFPDELLYVMKERTNVCKHIHLPAQSGSSRVLEAMRRGYTREAYMDLVENIRTLIPSVSLSSDFIVGFCGESEQDHQETLSLVKTVGYDMAYLFSYSMREKTMAHRRYKDDVPENVKQRRLRELIDLFYSQLAVKVRASIGEEVEVLVEGPSKKDPKMFSGRTDGNRTVVFQPLETEIPKIGDLVKLKITGVSGSTAIGNILTQTN